IPLVARSAPGWKHGRTGPTVHTCVQRHIGLPGCCSHRARPPPAQGGGGRWEGAARKEFSQVAVHAHPPTTTESVAVSNRAVGRPVGTGPGCRRVHHGDLVFFSRDSYAPPTARGATLLAHELVHVLQGGPGIRRQASAAGGAVPGSPAPPAPLTDTGGICT